MLKKLKCIDCSDGSVNNKHYHRNGRSPLDINESNRWNQPSKLFNVVQQYG